MSVGLRRAGLVSYASEMKRAEAHQDQQRLTNMATSLGRMFMGNLGCYRQLEIAA